MHCRTRRPLAVSRGGPGMRCRRQVVHPLVVAMLTQRSPRPHQPPATSVWYWMPFMPFAEEPPGCSRTVTAGYDEPSTDTNGRTPVVVAAARRRRTCSTSRTPMGTQRPRCRPLQDAGPPALQQWPPRPADGPDLVTVEARIPSSSDRRRAGPSHCDRYSAMPNSIGRGDSQQDQLGLVSPDSSVRWRGRPDQRHEQAYVLGSSRLVSGWPAPARSDLKPRAP